MRLALGGMLALLLVLAPTPALDPPDRYPAIGAMLAHAQGGMDIGIVSPSFIDLPMSVEPGQQFILTVSTAPGAGCAGRIDFRNQPQIDLDGQPARAGTCSWPVDVPPTVRPSTAIIEIDLSRSGQSWTLNGIVYVRAPGEPR
jgi:hypothetical protein